MTIDAIEHYRQLLTQRMGGAEGAMCITYARGTDENTIIRAFGGDPSATAVRNRSELGEELRPYHYNLVPDTLLVTTVGDWVIGIEENGFQGSRPEVMRGASAHDAAVSVYWNPHASTQFTYNIKGRRLVAFDLSNVDERWGDDPDALAHQLADVVSDDIVERWASGLVLAERITGVRLTEEILARNFRRAFLNRVPEDLIPEGNEDDPALNDPFVRSVVAEPTVDKLPAITRFLAHLVAEDAGVQHEPAVREALHVVDERAAGRYASAHAELRNRLQGLADDLQAASRIGPDPEAFRRMHAILGMIGALRDDPAEAARQVYWSGGYSLRDRGASLVTTVLDRCRARAISDAARPRG